VDLFDWNGIHDGDAVTVHRSADLGLVDGTVAVVTRSRGRRPNVVGVRLPDGTMAWPGQGAVHRRPHAGPTDGCWRCASLASAGS
jgi:hypothetical protein